MNRYVPGLHIGAGDNDGVLEGLFLVRIDRASYCWHQKKPFFALRFSVLDPKERAGQLICGRLYCTPKALWKLILFLPILDMTMICLSETKWMREPSLGSRECCGPLAPCAAAVCFRILTHSRPRVSGKFLQFQ